MTFLAFFGVYIIGFCCGAIGHERSLKKKLKAGLKPALDEADNLIWEI